MNLHGSFLKKKPGASVSRVISLVLCFWAPSALGWVQTSSPFFCDSRVTYMKKLKGTTSCDGLILNQDGKSDVSRDKSMKDPSRFGFLSLLIPAPGEPPCLKWKHMNEASERNIPLFQYSTFLRFNNVLMLNKDDGPEQAALGLSLSLTNFRRAPEALRHSCWGIQILTTNCALQLADGKARTLVYFRKGGSSSWFHARGADCYCWNSDCHSALHPVPSCWCSVGRMVWASFTRMNVYYSM